MMIIFLGPTITIAEANSILPQAKYLPPVQCGDIIRVLRLQPKIIAIIDGFFQDTAAVWHKELLLALEKGVKVYGASSMGALRAAELADLGMIGVGQIYTAYRSGAINDDDEVAVFHRPAESDYLSVSDAMVNIRATLAEAQSQDIINAETSSALINVAKQQYYKERSLQRALLLLKKNPQYTEALVQFEKWLTSSNFIDQKKQDAIELLTGLATGALQEKKSAQVPVVNRSLYLRNLQFKVMTRPFNAYYDWLPQPEKVLLKGRLLGETYLILKNIAELLAVVDALAEKQQLPLKEKAFANFTYPELSINIDATWLQENDCQLQDAAQLSMRMARIDSLLISADDSLQQEVGTINEFIIKELQFLNIFAKYTHHANDAMALAAYQEEFPADYKLRSIKALLWRFIYGYLKKNNLQPEPAGVQSLSDKFRQNKNLFTTEDMEAWLAVNRLDLPKYHQLIAMESFYLHVIKNHNINALEISCREDIFWLLDAFYVTGLYQHARKIFFNPKLEQVIIQNILSMNIQNKENFLKLLDFDGGLRTLLLMQKI
jgi:hypothetical protein